MPKRNEGSDSDTAIIDSSALFSVDGDKLYFQTEEIGSQLIYTIR